MLVLFKEKIFWSKLEFSDNTNQIHEINIDEKRVREF